MQRIAPIAECFRAGRIDGDRGVVCGNRLPGAPEGVERESLAMVGAGTQRVERDRRLEAGESLAWPAKLVEDKPGVASVSSGTRLGLDRGHQACDGFVAPTQACQRDAASMERLRMARVGAERSVAGREAFLVPAGLLEEDREVAVLRLVIGTQDRRQPRRVDGFVEAAKPAQRSGAAGLAIGSSCIVASQGQGMVEAGQSFLVSSHAQQREAEIVPGVAMLRINADGGDLRCERVFVPAQRRERVGAHVLVAGMDGGDCAGGLGGREPLGRTPGAEQGAR